jgi:CheY-like chemotaxis protein
MIILMTKQELKYTCTITYNNPLVALSEFKPHFYDLLLIDINMPDIDGFQFYEKILELGC